MSSNRPDFSQGTLFSLAQHVEEQFENEWREEQALLGARPWGNFVVLYEDQYCKVKKITVKPGKRLSYQSHEKRDEFWSLINGSGIVTFNDKNYQFYPVLLYGITTYRQFFIPKKSKHRVENPSAYEDLIFLEVQTGESFDENDIIRYEDDFGRA